MRVPFAVSTVAVEPIHDPAHRSSTARCRSSSRRGRAEERALTRKLSQDLRSPPLARLGLSATWMEAARSCCQEQHPTMLT